MTQENIQKKPLKIPFFQLYKLASKNELILIVLGTISAVLNGMMQPLFGQFFGEVSSHLGPQTTPDDLLHNCAILSGYFLLIGILSFLLSCSMLYCWINAGEKQAIKIRLAYYQSMIQQDISYFDSINTSELSTVVATDCFKIQQAIGEKLCMYIYTFSILVGSLVIAFMRGWQMALVSCIIMPIVWYSCKFLTWVSNGVTRKTIAVYQEAGGRAEQALGSIRTVKSLNGESFENETFHSMIFKAFKVSLKYSVFTGVAYGFQSMMIFLDYSLTFWFGSILIEHEITNHNMGRNYIYADVIVVFLSILLSSFRFGGATDSVKYFEEAQIAGHNIFAILDRKPIINQNEDGLNIKQHAKNFEIQFKDVKFSYPNRKEIDIFSNLSFKLKPNTKTAFVGKSGCGKSTIIQLIERFYNPTEGNIYIDDIDISKFQLNSLRQAIGYVSQEPILFSTTIRENLKFSKPDATEEEMIEALKKANVWSFIQKQEKKLDTFVGQNGTQLSGGQKQRICIARAILNKPKILLLDEATSALDSKNEALIQKTLDEVSQGLTTVIVAHRLSTIQSADEIIVIDNGQIAECGSHSQLMERRSFYFDLVKKQEEIEKEKNQNLQKQGSEEELFGTQIDLNLKKINSNQIFTLSTDQNLKTFNQLQLIENGLSHQQSSKQILNLQTQNQITELKTEACDLLFQDDTNAKQIREKVDKQINLKKKDEEEEQEKLRAKYTFGKTLSKLLSYNKSQIINFALGMFFSIGNGIAYPFSGWVFGSISDVLLNPNMDNFRKKADEYSLYFAIIGIVDFVSLILSYYFQSKMAESLTFKLRCDLFKKYLQLPISWFDKPSNHSAILAQQLHLDCQQVNILASTTITFNVSNISSLVSAIILGLTADWRTTLVGLGLMPLIVLSNIVYAIRMNIFSTQMGNSSEDTAKLINESSYNIRTVASLGNPRCFCDNFRNILSKNIKDINKSAFQAGQAIGFTNLSLFGVYAVIFLCGAVFHKYYDVTIRDVLVSILCLMFAALGIGKNTEYMGDAGASINSASKIFTILETKDEQQLNQGDVKVEQVQGEITFENVSFKYPQRDQYVLKNVSFTIPAKSKVAFVGSSGSGKSTIIQLIQRFYSDYTGKILLDGVDLKQYDLMKYRSYFGVVQQEPVLFAGSIKDNIIYNTANSTTEQVKEASKMANAYQFIESFKEGFEKQVGLRGQQISGGQKQRIAISRMILKKPQLMLLDEATSALDSQNEQAVQESLNLQMEGRTSISVAHRISTIRNSDIIFVLDNGQIVEQGDYQTLISNQNHFYQLLQQNNNQNIE